MAVNLVSSDKITASVDTNGDLTLDLAETYITSSGVTYEALSANSDVGTGSSQVAVGNHNHSGTYLESETLKSDPTGVTGADQITNAVSLTQAEYDNIGSKNSSTLYFITS